jgi:ABC-2 type transport system ATP-binding protein
MSVVPAIRFDGVSKSFPSVYGLSEWLRHRGRIPRRRALDDLSLTIAPRRLFGLLGPNGAGKTTTLKLMATLSLPDEGSITIDGIDAHREPDEVKRRIGLCTSEERSFYYRLTARENLEFFGALAGLRGRQRARRIAAVIEIVDLTDSIDQRFSTYSSGMRIRLALARALLADPDILLLDEPTRGVDPVHAEAIRRLMRDELVGSRGKTIVLTTNMLEEAWAVCDEVAIINAGRIVAQGAPAQLQQRIAGRIRYALSFDRLSHDLVTFVRGLAGVFEVSVVASSQTLHVELLAGGRALTEVLAAVTRNGVTVYAVRPLDDGLLDFFRTTGAGR